MPKFGAIPPTADTPGEWEEMVFPAGAGVGLAATSSSSSRSSQT